MIRHFLTSVVLLTAAAVAFLPQRTVGAQLEVPDFLKRAVPEAPAPKPVIAVFTLEGEITESPQDEALAIFGKPGSSLRQIVSRMRKAADDPNVKAVVILDEGGQLGLAQTEELRQAMQHLKDAGRDVFVNADSLHMGKYALFASATRLSVVPTGDIWVTGIFAEQPYVRGLLDKISVKPDFLSIGDYKSAAEILMRDAPSEQADAMMNWLLDGLYGTLVDMIAKGRNVDAAKAKAWIDNGPYTAEKAKEAGLIDAVEHREQFQAMIKTRYGVDIVFDRQYGDKDKPDIDFSSPLGILKLWGEMLSGGGKQLTTNKDAVGVVYVEGPIMLGAAEASPFGKDTAARSSDIRKALDDAANDDSIKAVVLRVNSPGGSATASEIILEGTKRVKNRKPLVVSMGNVAGSGGYYVACGADTIFADESTITGSIGVVGGKLATTEMWKRVGVTWKPYKRGENSGILSTYEVFSPKEREKMLAWMNDVYNVFKGHVNAARGNRLKKPLDEIAGGRVYTGKQALELGLVDKIGSLQDAIAYAAQQARLPDDHDVRTVPEPKSFLELFFEGMSGADKHDKHRLLRTVSPSLWDLAVPHLAGMDPQRVAAIRQAFVQIGLLQDEGVVLMMPPVLVHH